LENVFDVLSERGFIEQCTHAEEIKALLGRESVTFYIGFDPTADSLTIGGFLQIMAMMHMQRAGHRPIVILGGGTGMVGDPTDKTDMRRVMEKQEIQRNIDRFREQMSRFLDFSEGKARMVNNADWLMELKYVPFIREYGVHFSVNRMLTADCYKTRYERGLTFFEFNYMLMQSYDFLELYRRYHCLMQCGGRDQWSNILGGVELIRRVEGADAYGMTFALLQSRDGRKMGKTAAGAVWIDPNKTSPYDFYQYLRNIDDQDVENCLALLTFLPMDEVRRLGALEDAGINRAKEVLAYEVTKIVHGEAEAVKAQSAARALFSGVPAPDQEGGSIPTTRIPLAEIADGINVIELLKRAGLISSGGEGRRLIEQGGVRIDDVRVASWDHTIMPSDYPDKRFIITKGKKIFHKIELL